MLSAERDKYADHLKSIRSVMNVNYDLLMHNMGEAPPETYAKTRSYIDYVGIEGVAVEMAVSDGTEVGGVGALHTEKILEADYTLLLQFLNMLIECQE